MELPEQTELFEAVQDAYADTMGAPLSNTTLYRNIQNKLEIADSDMAAQVPLGGSSGSSVNPLKRAIRWHQQSLKHLGLLEKANQRGVWQLTGSGKRQLVTISRPFRVIAFSTRLGCSLLADCSDVFGRLHDEINLVLVSPPYPLATGRRYGNPTEPEYVDWLCDALGPVFERLADGGSVALNVSNDIFERGLPSRSLYRERLLLTLADRFGLAKMDELIWTKNSPPGPTKWACVDRVQLCANWEPVYWLSNNPSKVASDNRRVLEPHTERHKRLIAAGGEQSMRTAGDGAYSIRSGDFGRPTKGRIPRNVLTIGSYCADQRRYKKAAREAGLPAHGAPFPVDLASFLIRFLTEENELVVDPMAGSQTTAVAAEALGRRWLTCERARDYAIGGGTRLDSAKGFQWGPMGPACDLGSN